MHTSNQFRAQALLVVGAFVFGAAAVPAFVQGTTLSGQLGMTATELQQPATETPNPLGFGLHPEQAGMDPFGGDPLNGWTMPEMQMPAVTQGAQGAMGGWAMPQATTPSATSVNDTWNTQQWTTPQMPSTTQLPEIPGGTMTPQQPAMPQWNAPSWSTQPMTPPSAPSFAPQSFPTATQPVNSWNTQPSTPTVTRPTDIRQEEFESLQSQNAANLDEISALRDQIQQLQMEVETLRQEAKQPAAPVPTPEPAPIPAMPELTVEPTHNAAPTEPAPPIVEQEAPPTDTPTEPESTSFWSFGWLWKLLGVR